MQGWKAADVFHAYLDELLETAQGVSVSRDARTSIATYLDRATLNTNRQAEALVNRALQAIPKIHVSTVNRALFICAHAGFEQYLRDLLEMAANSISNCKFVRTKAEAPRKEVLRKLHGHQIQLAGEGFRRYFEPLSHIRLDYAKVASAVAQSSDEDAPFILNGTVLGLRVGNIDRKALDSIFGRFDCKIPWLKFAATANVQGILKETTIKATDKAVNEFLSQALEKRNRIAHTQGSIEMPEEEFYRQIQFLREVSSFLNKTMSDHISTLASTNAK